MTPPRIGNKEIFKMKTPNELKAPDTRLYSLWVRMYGVRPGGKRYDAGYWSRVSSEAPLSHQEALTVRSKHMEPKRILLHPFGMDPNTPV